MSTPPSHLRSLYRSILRELPHRTPSKVANPSPMQQRIRSQFSSSSPANDAEAVPQFIAYLRSQRLYTTLLERYNPGMDMNDEERIRLTARRVGMELPKELQPFIGGGEVGNKP